MAGAHRIILCVRESGREKFSHIAKTKHAGAARKSKMPLARRRFDFNQSPSRRDPPITFCTRGNFCKKKKIGNSLFYKLRDKIRQT